MLSDRMPGFNFAFHCETPISPEYPKLFRCPKIEDGIKECQKNGKKVLMSLGGAVGRSGFSSQDDAKLFAYRVYHLLLEGEELQSLRPFGRLVILFYLVLFLFLSQFCFSFALQKI